MDKELARLLGRKTSEFLTSELLKYGINTKESFLGLTPRRMALFSQELRESITKILSRQSSYYNVSELMELISTKLLERNHTERLEENIREELDNYQDWSELQLYWKDLEKFGENKGIMEFLFIISDLDQIQIRFVRIDSEILLKYLALKKLAYDKRIPMKDSISDIKKYKNILKKRIIDEQIKGEYNKRCNRNNMKFPPPTISLQFPQTMEEIEHSKIFELNLEHFAQFLEDFPKDNYNVVSFIGKVGAGKSFFIRSAISSQESFAPQSNFRTGGTSVDICTYKTNFQVMTGEKTSSNDEENVILFDTEGTDACSRNGNLHLDPAIMNQCLNSILPLTHLISTVIIFVVHEDELRHASFENELKRFKEGMQANEYRKPALIILVNKIINSIEDTERVAKEKIRESYSILKDSFHSIDYYLFPAIKKTENSEKKNIITYNDNNNIDNNNEMSLETTKKLKHFFELVLSKIKQVNYEQNEYLKSMLKFDSISYIPLLVELCNTLPKPFNERPFWSNQIQNRLQIDSSPASNCMNYILQMEKLSNNLSVFSKLNDNHIIEKLFVSYCILFILEKKREENAHNINDQPITENDNEIEFQLKMLLEHHTVLKNSYKTLHNFIQYQVPCGATQDGEYCILPYHAHENFHKFKFRVFKVRSSEGDFLPMFQIPDYLNNNLVQEIIENAKDSNGLFNENLFFKNLLDSIILSQTQIQSKSKSKAKSSMKRSISKKFSKVITKTKLLLDYNDSNLCRICFNDTSEYFFSCGNTHSMCNKCLIRFQNSIATPDSQKESGQRNTINRNVNLYCPFCETQMKASICHIRHIFGYDNSTNQFEFKEIVNQYPENSLYIISIIGNISKNSHKELQDIIKVPNAPAAFVQFVQYCRAIKHWSLFTDDKLGIVYYYCKNFSTFSRENLNTISRLSSTNVIYTDSSKFITKEYWYSKFFLLNANNQNLPDNDPNNISLSDIQPYYSRAAWSSIMKGISFTKAGTPNLTYCTQFLHLKKLLSSIISINNIYHAKTVDHIIKHFARLLAFTSLQVVLDITPHSILQNQIINTMRLLINTIFLNINGSNNSGIDIDSSEYQSVILHKFELFWKKELNLNEVTFATLPLHRLYSVIQFVQIDSFAEIIKPKFNTKSFHTKSNQLICYLCFKLFGIQENLGCKNHPICNNCWENSYSILINSLVRDPDPSYFNIVQSIFSIITIDQLFKCLICDSILFASFRNFLHKNEKKSFNISQIILSLFTPLNDRNNKTYIAIPNSLIHPIASNSKKRRDYIIQEQINAYGDLPPYRGTWINENRDSVSILIQTLSESNQQLLHSIEIASLFSSLPFFQRVLGVQFTVNQNDDNNKIINSEIQFNPTLLCFQYNKNSQLLSNQLNNQSVDYFTSIDVVYISIKIARTLRLLIMCGIYWNIQPQHILIPKSPNTLNMNSTDEDSDVKLLIMAPLPSEQTSSTSTSPSSLSTQFGFKRTRSVYKYFVILFIQLLLRSISYQYYAQFLLKLRSLPGDNGQDNDDNTEENTENYLTEYKNLLNNNDDLAASINKKFCNSNANILDLIQNSSSLAQWLNSLDKLKDSLVPPEKPRRSAHQDNILINRSNYFYDNNGGKNKVMIKEIYLDEHAHHLYETKLPCNLAKKTTIQISNSVVFGQTSPSFNRPQKSRFLIGERPDNPLNLHHTPLNNNNNIQNNNNINSFIDTKPLLNKNEKKSYNIGNQRAISQSSRNSMILPNEVADYFKKNGSNNSNNNNNNNSNNNYQFRTIRKANLTKSDFQLRPLAENARLRTNSTILSHQYSPLESDDHKNVNQFTNYRPLSRSVIGTSTPKKTSHIEFVDESEELEKLLHGKS